MGFSAFKKALFKNTLFKNTLVFFFGVSALLALGACGASGGGSGNGRLVPQGYDAKNCAQDPPDAGPQALYQNKNRTDFVRGPLEKIYDRADLEAVLDASAFSTTEYVSSLGVQLFRIPREQLGSACQTFFNLPTPPSALQSRWNEISGGTTGGFRLAGLYFDDCDRCQDRVISQPTILVDEAADRWTLVHEMMHYNFNQGRVANPNAPGTYLLSSQLRQVIAKIERWMEKYQASGDPTLTSVLAAETEKMARITVSLTTSSAFEEVALEALLIQEWAEGHFVQKNLWAPQSSLKYMQLSQANGLKRFDEVLRLTRFLRQQVTEKTLPEDVLPAIIRAEQTLIDAQKSTDDLIRDSQRRVRAKLPAQESPSDRLKWQTNTRRPQRLPEPDPQYQKHLDHLEGAAGLDEMAQRLKKMGIRYGF